MDGEDRVSGIECEYLTTPVWAPNGESFSLEGRLAAFALFWSNVRTSLLLKVATCKCAVCCYDCQRLSTPPDPHDTRPLQTTFLSHGPKPEARRRRPLKSVPVLDPITVSVHYETEQDYEQNDCFDRPKPLFVPDNVRATASVRTYL